MIILMHGPDTYRLSGRLGEFVSIATERNGEMNVEIIDCAKKTLDDVRPSLEALPFLGEKRLVILKSFLQLDAEEGGKMFDFLQSFSSDLVNVIFYESEKPDARRKLFKWLQDNAKSYVFDLLDGRELDAFIRDYVRARNVDISPDALSLLVSMVGGEDLYLLCNELDKLCSFVVSGVISIDEVKLLVKGSVHSDIFGFIDALSRKDFVRAHKSFNDLLLEGSNEYYIFTMMIYGFRNLILVSYYSLQGMDKSQIAKVAKLHPFVVQKTLQCARNFSPDDLRLVYSQLLQIDLSSKTVSGYDLSLEIDLFAHRVCVK